MRPTLLFLFLTACPEKSDEDPIDTDTTVPLVDADGDGSPEGEDCDDQDELVSPDARDIPYDGIDQDCDGADVTDVDGDGYDAEEAGGDDCYDGNPEVHPGAEEVCYNAFDDDCDGWYSESYDCDGDGYEQGQDCDDEDATRYPGAEDTWYDGIDQDCDNADDYDQDADGESRSEDGGTDCDDLDAAVNTEAEEAWNAVDDDCDGVVDTLTTRTTTTTWTGDNYLSEALFAWDFATTPDLSGDGVRDVLIGIPGTSEYYGKAYLLAWESGISVPTDIALGTAYGEDTVELGASVLATDDGALVLVGAPGTTVEGGAVYAFASGDMSGGAELYVASAIATIEFDYAGGALDLWSGDHVLASSQYVDGAGSTVALFAVDALQGTLTTDDAAWVWTGDQGTIDSAAVGDLDGDGVEELAFAAYDRAGSMRAFVASGEAVEAGDADVEGVSGFGTTLLVRGIPDVDGDGGSELVVSAYDADTTVTAGGKAWIVLGPDAIGAGTAENLAFATISGEIAGGQLRATTSADLDEDGTVDLLTCEPGDAVSEIEGRCRVTTGAELAAGGALVPGTGTPTWDAVAPDDLFGWAALAEDLEGDGDVDVLISSLGDSGGLRTFTRE